MIKRKIILAVILAGSLISSSISTYSVSAEGTYAREMKAFKGTISEIAAATQKNEVNEIPFPYHVDLTTLHGELKNSALLDDYANKQRVKQDIPTIKKMIEEAPSRFAGHYYDADTGTVTVLITEDSEPLKKLVREAIKNKDKVEFNVSKFSWLNIVDAKEKIKKSVKPGTVLALIPDIKNNKLIIALDEKSDIKEKLAVSSLLTKPDMLEFTTLPASALKVETDNTNWGALIPMGSKISGNIRPKPGDPTTSIYSICTGGYYGINSSDQDVLVTSGHCQTVGTVSAWYQPTWVTNTIGNYSFRTTSPGDGSSAVSDSGYITLNSNYIGRPRVPYPSSSNMAMVTGVYTSDTVGDTIYLRGANSGTTTSGTIEYANVDIWWGGDGYGYKNNEVMATGYTSMGGDSGGPILTDYAYNNDLEGWTFDIAGIHTGVVTLPDTESGIEAGTYKVYEPIWTSFNDLSLSGIYLVAP
ncbi:hypothetical protein FHS16_001634 [Paenibacillus endophyticus]|uniref:Peptidase S1 domain-containing protein n=1 Tax=Paenibacillus endophyticus TaxID=1294268 RepID=A0A7W5C5U2_9BACL|nr:hypothetical protein [Paenibacillus endophyticus]MBB3151588.1 hypothetical protein [Paenibacillus endophyticus]